MTDKIIIDGVNVAGCKNLYVPQESKICQCLDCETGEFVQCKREVDCYYKQLKHKQEECEKLKTQLIQRDDIDTFFNTPIEGWFNDPCGVCEYKGEYKQLKSENERLKEENRQALKQLEFSRTHKTLLYTESIKYKQALDEIDNLLENLCNHCVVGNNNYCEISECKTLEVKQIIKAVKDE